jgi:hypothetical protein
MGKIQCTSLKQRSDNWLMIERYLNNINTPLDKKIHDEYYSIKNKRHSETDLTHIPFNKRMHRFVKWYKMASPGGGLDAFNRNMSDKLPRTPVKKNISSPLHSMVISEDMYKSFVNNTDIKCRRSMIGSIDFDSNAQSISLNSNISTNKVEMNLRNVYLMNRSRFCQKVSKGVPDCFRWLSWMICSQVPEDRSEDLFAHYYKETIDEEIDIQIKKDLNRTLSEIYDINAEDTQNFLYRLLRAFGNLDKVVAYCQGMNFIAGFLLLLSDFNEVDSFYMLINLFSISFSDNFGIRGFYTDDFPLLKAYLYAFDFYFHKKCPVLFKHFKALEIPDEVWIAKWFQTLYTICLPLNVLVRFWDCLFSSGLEFLISFSLGLIQQLEKDLLKLEDAFDVTEFFKKMGPFFTPGGMKIHLNIEDIIQNAKKYNITRTDVNGLIKEHEKVNKVNLSPLSTKYETNIFRYSSFKPDECGVFEIVKKKSSVSYNGENLIIVQDNENDEGDCDEFILDDIGDKLDRHKFKLTQIKAKYDDKS